MPLEFEPANNSDENFNVRFQSESIAFASASSSLRRTPTGTLASRHYDIISHLRRAKFSLLTRGRTRDDGQSQGSFRRQLFLCVDLRAASEI